MGLPDPPKTVDDLRARLRELGYLDAGVDRFVLGPVRISRGLASVASRSAARIGLLAGLLLGPSTAASLGARLPGLVTSVRDGVILAGYLGLLLGAGAAAGAFAAVVATGVLARRAPFVQGLQPRARVLARAAGGTVAVAGLAYLVLWWRSLPPAGAIWSSVAWTVPALAGATAISLLLGHAVFVTALAAIAHGTGAQLPDLRLQGGSRRTRIGLAILAFAAGAALLLLTTRFERPGPSATPRPALAVNTGARVIVLAIDGFDPDFFERVAARGQAPRLARLAAGARAVLAPGDAPDPARTWTSLATGQPAGVHGISGIETRRVSGIRGAVPAGRSPLATMIAAATDLVRLTRPAVASALDRRAKTFWEVASEYGRRTAVVAWWATWPAPEDAGIVLTDRATLRLDRGGSPDGEIAPTALVGPLIAAWPDMRAAARASAVRAFPGPDEPVTRALRRAAELDETHIALARRVTSPDIDLVAIYLPGLDIAQYALLAGPGGAGLPPAVAAARVEALERYYGFLDAAIAPLIDTLGTRDLVVLLTDPGRSPSPARGLLVLAGATARPAARLEATPASVAPTILYLLGVPASLEVPGRPLSGLIADGFRERVPMRTVPTYGQRPVTARPRGGAPLDQEMIDRLRSLGYVR